MDHTITQKNSEYLVCKLASAVPKAAISRSRATQSEAALCTWEVKIMEFDYWNSQILGETVAMTPCCAAGSGVSVSGKWPKSDHIKKIFAFLLCGGQILFPLEVVDQGTNTTFHSAPAE